MAILNVGRFLSGYLVPQIASPRTQRRMQTNNQVYKGSYIFVASMSTTSRTNLEVFSGESLRKLPYEGKCTPSLLDKRYVEKDHPLLVAQR